MQCRHISMHSVWPLYHLSDGFANRKSLQHESRNIEYERLVEIVALVIVRVVDPRHTADVQEITAGSVPLNGLRLQHLRLTRTAFAIAQRSQPECS